MSRHPLSLYIHIPFCSLKCSYCDFNSYAGLEALVRPYVDALIAEITLWSEFARGRPVATVFFGGGTPSLLPLPEVERVTSALRECFELQAEAEHGFVHDPERPAHRPEDAADVWHRALAFLGE